jgi:hypothetical protein
MPFDLFDALSLKARSGDPSSPAEGDFWYASGLKYRSSSATVTIADDSTVVKLTGTQTIGGNKTFTGAVSLSTLAVSAALSSTAGPNSFATPSATSSSTSGTNWLSAPIGTPCAFLGDGASTSALTASQMSTAVRFNGAAVAWGDLAYFPNGGGLSDAGHFRFSTSGSSLGSAPNAKLGVGALFVNPNDSGYALTVHQDGAGGVLVGYTQSASGTFAYSYVAGDSVARYYVQSDGKTTWGSGSGAGDVTMYRSGVLALRIIAYTTIERAATTSNALATFATGEAAQRFLLSIDGKHQWGNGTTVDTNLYRSAADTLKTDDSLVVGTALSVVGNVGFFNTTPVAKPTGVGVTAADIHAALVTLGLIAA